MRLILHPKVYSDIDEITERYERVANLEIADEFYAELRRFIGAAAMRPESFSVREHDIRGVNLEHFPYHFLFRFAHIKNYPPQDYHGIIVLRLARQDRDTVLAIMPRILTLLQTEPIAQRLWMVDDNRTRIRGTP